MNWQTLGYTSAVWNSNALITSANVNSIQVAFRQFNDSLATITPAIDKAVEALKKKKDKQYPGTKLDRRAKRV